LTSEVRILGASPEALIANCRSGFTPWVYPAIFQVERDYRGIKPLLHPTKPKQASGYGTHGESKFEQETMKPGEMPGVIQNPEIDPHPGPGLTPD
jgi:hypothetical protein